MYTRTACTIIYLVIGEPVCSTIYSVVSMENFCTVEVHCT